MPFSKIKTLLRAINHCLNFLIRETLYSADLSRA